MHYLRIHYKNNMFLCFHSKQTVDHNERTFFIVESRHADIALLCTLIHILLIVNLYTFSQICGPFLCKQQK